MYTAAILVVLVALDLSVGLLRGYRNSRTWGTGRQGRVLRQGVGQRLRTGRQQVDIDNDIAAVAARCGDRSGIVILN